MTDLIHKNSRKFTSKIFQYADLGQYLIIVYSYNTGAPRIINDTQLNITGVDYTVSTGNSINPCIYQFNDSYALVCNVTSMPAPQLTWYYQSTLPEEIVIVNITDGFLQYNIDNNTSVLVISNLTRNNAGIYYCNATNDIGFDLLTIQAFVARTYVIIT